MKFHPDSCVHAWRGFAFWCTCPRHGDYYYLCPECNIETIKDYMIESGFKKYDELVEITGEDLLALQEEYKAYLKGAPIKAELNT